ncbi:MAG: glycosyltransferase [Candidatus Gallimonas sp.]
MIIVLVTDQFYQNHHGMSISAQRLRDALVALGHEVRVAATDGEGRTPFALKERTFFSPVDKIIRSQGYAFARTDEKTLLKAIEGADVVHVLTPFSLGRKTAALCAEKGIPCTAAVHILPENITASIYMKKCRPLNAAIWARWRSLYRRVKHVHCPSAVIEREFSRRCRGAVTHVISNGYDSAFVMRQEEKPALFQGKFVIAVTGRFSREKRFDLAIEGVKRSKYRDKILLIFGGSGPLKGKIMRAARKLPVSPVFLGHYDRRQQLSLLNFADLYLHPADVEAEGMTCVEAIVCGCVPLVSDARKSAASQFAVHEKSVFHHGNADDLARKIDWWIEHGDERMKEREKVAAHAGQYSVARSAEKYLEMFEQAAKDGATV